jgi:hypothetical protein
MSSMASWLVNYYPFPYQSPQARLSSRPPASLKWYFSPRARLKKSNPSCSF